MGKKYEIVSNNTEKRVLGRVWTEGNSVKSDNWRLLHMLKTISIHVSGKELTYKDGQSFLDKLPLHYNNGYVTVRPVIGE